MRLKNMYFGSLLFNFRFLTFMNMCLSLTFRWPQLKDMRIIENDGLFACERICPGIFQVDKMVDDGLLRGCCRSVTDPTSKAAEIHGITILSLDNTLRTSREVTFSFGNRLEDVPSDTSLWDGTGANAIINDPEELIQSKSGLNMYFLDSKSCLREISRTSNLVTTILGDCTSGTLSIAGVRDGQANGMAYLEEDQMFVFSISSYGLYLCQRKGRQEFDECKKVVDSSDYTSTGQQIGKELVRGRMGNGIHNNQIWQKVTNGINRYDLTSSIMNYEEDAMPMLNFDNQKFIRYISASTSDQLDFTAQHQLNALDLGDGVSIIGVSPKENFMLLADSEQNKMYFVDVKASAGQDVLRDACEDSYARTGNEIKTLDYCDFTGAETLDLLVGEYEPEPKFLVEEILSITTVDLPDPYPATEKLEFICLNTLQVDKKNEERLLVGVCDYFSSSGIGYLPISILEGDSAAGVTVLFGNPEASTPESSDLWDGIGTDAAISLPEHLTQTSDGENMYFLDGYCCLRKINRESQQVTTVLGTCGTLSTLGDWETSASARGMAYFESRQLFVFEFRYKGLYMCYQAVAGIEDYTCKWAVLDYRVSLISRGFDENGAQNNYIWRSVAGGIIRYDMTKVFNNLQNDSLQIMPDDEAYVYYARVKKGDDLETEARYKDNSQSLGEYCTGLFPSTDGKRLQILAPNEGGLYVLDTDEQDGIARIKKYCDQTNGSVVENNVEGCRLTNMSGGVWLHDRKMTLVTEWNPGRIRIVRFKELPTTTTSTTTTTAATSTAAVSTAPSLSSPGWTWACITICLWITSYHFDFTLCF